MPEAKVVCVVNNYDIFNKVVKSNENLKNCEITDYDNTTENIAITKRYNDFIKNNIKANSDFWIAFIHQDFGFLEDVKGIFEKLDTDCIYGAIGPKTLDKTIIDKNGLSYSYSIICGKILQGNNDFNFEEFGFPVKEQEIVDAIDCCCIIIHSSLIRKYNLRFDENLDFHMYAEELCYRAKKDYGIKTKVVQMECYHMGKGSFNEEFQKSVEYLKAKFKINSIPSTCQN